LNGDQINALLPTARPARQSCDNPPASISSRSGYCAAFVGDSQCCLGDEFAGIGALDQPGQVNERRDPNGADLQARGQLVEELLGEFGREP